MFIVAGGSPETDVSGGPAFLRFTTTIALTTMILFEFVWLFPALMGSSGRLILETVRGLVTGGPSRTKDDHRVAKDLQS